MEPSSSSSSPRVSSSPSSLSINKLAQLNCRERLIVDPILWTSRHVELLQCCFEEPTQAPLTKPLSDYTGGKTGRGFVIALSKCVSDSWREVRVLQIVTDPECPLTNLRNLHFYFNQRIIRTLPCDILFRRGNRDDMTQGRVPPVAAYIDRAHIDSLRSDYLYRYRGRRYSEPTEALYRLKLEKVTPTEPLHDPYIIALLLGLAHRQRYALSLSRDEEQVYISSTFLSQVLFTDFDDNKNIHLFTADIPSSFLQKLDFPDRPPSPLLPRLLPIRHTIIPYKPRHTFRNRLFPLLLPPL